MPLFQVFMILLIVCMVVLVILNIVLNPIVWGIVVVLFLISSFRKYKYRKEMQEYHAQFKQKTQAKKRSYYQDNTSQHTKNSDVIDVTYTVHDEE